MIKTSSLGLKKVFEWSTFIFCIWYFMPAVNVAFQSTVFKLAFFACLMIGLIGYMMCNGFRINGVTLSILIYYLIFAIFFIFDVGDASSHIRVSFTFWGLGLMFFGVVDEKSKISLGKKLLIIFIITCATSALGVMLDNAAARTLTQASADDSLQTAYKAKNIADIYIFQSMVCFVPVFAMLAKTKKAKFCSLIMLVLIFAILLNASFTISIITYVFSLIMSVCLKYSGGKRFGVLFSISIVALLVILNGAPLLTFIGDVLNNPKISQRIYELRDLIYIGDKYGDAGARVDLYLSSFKVFLEKPFGVGPSYSYIRYENGIGYHSKIFDDLARYGVFAIAFYILFFIGYYKVLKKEWEKVDAPRIPIVIVLTYILFLFLNIGHRSPSESLCMLFILPALPSIILDFRQKKLSK